MATLARGLMIGIAVLLLAACGSVASDPCYGRTDSTECNLYKSQMQATLEASDRNRIAEATKQAGDAVIEQTRQASAILQAEALAQAGATATVQHAQTQAQIDAANSQATLSAVRIAEQRYAAEATTTAVANAIALSNQNLAATATAQSQALSATAAAQAATLTAQAASDESAIQHQKADNELAVTRITGIADGFIRFALGTLVLAIAIYILYRVLKAAVLWLHNHAARFVDGEGRAWHVDGNAILDPRLLLTAFTNLKAANQNPITDELSELWLRYQLEMKKRDQIANVYETMARHGTDVDEGESAFTETARQIGPDGEAPSLLELPKPPTFAQLMTTWHPTPDQMLLAYGARGPLYGRLSDLLSVAIVGRQGQGKTSLLRLIYAQCCMIGVEAIVWDLHSDVVNDLPGTKAYTTVAEIEASAASVGATLEHRILGNLRHERPTLVLADEFNASADACSSIVLDVCKRVILEGRKYGVYCLLSAKGLPASLFGGSLVRDSLSSHVAFNTSVRQASLIGFDVEDARCVTGLKPGQALFDGPVQAQIVTFPLTEAEDIKRLLPASGSGGSGAKATSKAGNGSGNGSGSEAAAEVAAEVAAIDEEKRLRVLELIRQGKGVSDIVREVWEVSGGNAYIKAAAEFSRILPTLLAG